MADSHMHLKVLLPYQVLVDKDGITRLAVDTSIGSTGFLPHRLDCVATVLPGIIVFETESEGETYLAVDDGVLIKTGREVTISVRNAVMGTDLVELNRIVENSYQVVSEQEQNVKEVMAKMETGFLRRLQELHNERR
jgi:F-type H+-transporting ATPase subunit epsilon